MGSFIFETGVLIGLTLNPNYHNDNRQRPYLLAEKTFSNNIYLKGYTESEMYSMHTKDAKMLMEFGYKSPMKEFGQFTIGMGHNFEQETFSIEGFNKDFDYLKVSYRIEY